MKTSSSKIPDSHGEVNSLSPEERQKLFHDLYSRQRELETQNEELRSSLDEITSKLKKYTDLYDLTSEEGGFVPEVSAGNDHFGMVQSQLFWRVFLRCPVCGCSYYKIKEMTDGVEYYYECGMKLRKYGVCSRI